MSASPSPRNTKPRKGPDAPASRGRGAWRGGTPNFVPAPGRQFGPSGAFPPLQGAHGPAHHFMLATLVGSQVVLTTRTNQRWEGTLAAVATDDGQPGASLRNVKDLNNTSAPIQEHVFVPAAQIGSCLPQGAQPAPQQPPPPQQQQPAWGNNVDELTFGPGAGSSGGWDQFSANEKMFGVVTSFNEEAYTTSIDRNAPDFKEKERKAEMIAKEIMAATTNNPHIAEERGAVDDSGMNEEDKYSSVIRGQNAYVPPGARRAAAAAASQTNGSGASPAPTPGAKSPPAAKSPPPTNANNATVATTAASTPAAETKPEVPKVAVNGTEARAKPEENNLVGSFREFMSNEKQRLAQKKQAIVKSEKEKRMAELVAFSQNFKLNKPIPKDLVSILTKDTEKAKQIVEKSSQDAASAKARQIGGPQVVASTSGTLLKKAAPPAAGAPSGAAATGKAAKMVIQAIPPFNPNKLRGPAAAAQAAVTAAKKDAKEAQSLSVKPVAGGKEREPSPTSAALRLNANAPMFKPGHGASASVSASAAATPSPKPKAAADAPAAPPNPFYGARTFKKSQMMLKEEFNPFKFAKVAEASSVPPNWPYTGRKFLMLFPGPTVPPQPSQPPPPQPQQQPPAQAPQAPQPQPPHPPPPMQQQATPPVPGPYEEDHSRSPYMMYPYPYPYPGQPPMQPMMQVPPTSAPPGYMQPPYMQPMPYPPHQMAPNQPMYGAPMPGMPHMYMPPGPYPPGGAPRGSMPPPHGYYHQSPQLGHAVPYPMMMQGGPPGAPTPHPYDPQGPPNGPPGGPLGVGH